MDFKEELSRFKTLPIPNPELEDENDDEIFDLKEILVYISEKISSANRGS